MQNADTYKNLVSWEKTYIFENNDRSFTASISFNLLLAVWMKSTRDFISSQIFELCLITAIDYFKICDLKNYCVDLAIIVMSFLNVCYWRFVERRVIEQVFFFVRE